MDSGDAGSEADSEIYYSEADSEVQDGEADFEDSEVDYECESGSSDLEELYSSFAYEDDAFDRSEVSAVATSRTNGSGEEHFVQHSMTTKALTELLQLLSVHLPKGASIANSVHSLKQFFIQCFPETQAQEHYYCECCERSLPFFNYSCTGNGFNSASQPTIFITIPIAPQLKRMIEDPFTWRRLQERFGRVCANGVVTDIYDGEGYKRHSEFLSVNLASVGGIERVACIAKISEAVHAVNYSRHKPVMNMFLRPIIDDINLVHREGVAVQTPNGGMTARVILLGFSVDLPARASITNMKQWNGVNGCLYCEDPGITLGTDHLHHYWPYYGSPVARTQSSLLRNAELATMTGTSVCGVKGPTVLALHPPLDVVWGIVIDDLHGIFLGVTLTLLKLWFNKSHRGKQFFIGNKIKECDERLLAIKVTDSMSRVPRTLGEYARWKGAELRNWLLFFSLPVLPGILPKEYLNHLALLVSGIYIFSSQEISHQELSLGEELLKQFYQRFSILYGTKFTTMNVHMLQHLPKCVKLWGPLWCYSCFHFETMNGHLKFLFHGTKDMTKQLAFSYIVMQALPPTLSLFHQSSNSISTFASILYGKKKVTKQVLTTEVSVLGGVSLKLAQPGVLQVLREYLVSNGLDLPQGPLTTVFRIEVRGKVYYSRQYQRVKKRNSFTIAYLDGDGLNQFGLIEYFVVVYEKVIAIVQPLKPLSVSPTQHFDISSTVLDTLSFITPVITASSFKCCFVEDIVSAQYIVQFPSSVVFY